MRHMSNRPAARVAWTLFALTLVLYGLQVAFLALTGGRFLSEPAKYMPDLLVSVCMVVFVAIGALIASHRPNNPIGWIYIAIGLASHLRGVFVDLMLYLAVATSGSTASWTPVAWLAINLWVVTFALVPLLFLLFPNGRLLGPRWRVVVWVVGVVIIGGLLSSAPDLQFGGLHVPFANPLAYLPASISDGAENVIQGASGIGMALTFVAAAVALIIRFVRSRGEEREQMKWFALASLLDVLVLSIPMFFNDQIQALDPNAPYPAGIFLGIPTALALIALPLATAIAILRYRLWDIDVIIRRTLIYSALTVILALVYFGSVTLLQHLLSALTGQRSDIAIIVSTLAIAALFIPVRNRVQYVIDTHFYRRKYNAAQVLADFAATVRDEVDLNQITEELVAVVSDTMQPQHVSLWLKKTDDGRRRTEA